MLLPLKCCMFIRAFSAKNNQVQRPNILCWTFALRSSFADVICAGRRYFFILLIFFCCSFSSYAESSVKDIFIGAINSIAADRSAPMVVSIGNFTYADKKVGSSFSKYLQEELSTAISVNPGFELFARDRLDEMLQALELSLSDLFDQSTVKETGKLKGIEGIFSGRFFDLGLDVRLFLELVDIERGTVINKTQLLIPKSLIPTSVSIIPDNYNDAMFVIDELSEIQNADNPDFMVKAWTPKGEGGIYRGGVISWSLTFTPAKIALLKSTILM